MSRGNSGIGYWLQRGVGVFLGVAVLAYMGVVTVRGGVISNPKRPRDPMAIMKAQTKYEIRKQDSAKLFKKSTEQKGWRGKYLKSAHSHGMQLIQERINYHKALAFGEQTPREGYSNDLAAWTSVEFAQFPAEYKVAVESVERKTVYYKSRYHYEMLGASAKSPEEVFKNYLDKLVDLQWKVTELIYVPENLNGIVTAERGKWHLVVGVTGVSVFPGQPTTVFWRMDRTDYDEEDELDEDDEQAWEFIGLLGDYYVDY